MGLIFFSNLNWFYTLHYFSNCSLFPYNCTFNKSLPSYSWPKRTIWYNMQKTRLICKVIWMIYWFVETMLSFDFVVKKGRDGERGWSDAHYCSTSFRRQLYPKYILLYITGAFIHMPWMCTYMCVHTVATTAEPPLCILAKLTFQTFAFSERRREGVQPVGQKRLKPAFFCMTHNSYFIVQPCHSSTMSERCYFRTLKYKLTVLLCCVDSSVLLQFLA